MNCKTIQQDMESRTEPFSASELAVMDPHLASCAGCRQSVAKFQKLVTMFKKSFPAPKILESLSRKVLAHSEISTAAGEAAKTTVHGFPWTLWALIPALGSLLILAQLLLPRGPAPVTSRPELVSAWVWGKISRKNLQGQTVGTMASGSEMVPGETLILPPAANCRLELASGTLLHVTGAGRLQAQAEELKVLTGTMEVTIHHPSPGFHIRLPTVVLGVRGTSLRLEVTEKLERVTVLSGCISVTGPNVPPETILQTGETWPPTIFPVAPPASMTPATASSPGQTFDLPLEPIATPPASVSPGCSDDHQNEMTSISQEESAVASLPRGLPATTSHPTPGRFDHGF